MFGMNADKNKKLMVKKSKWNWLMIVAVAIYLAVLGWFVFPYVKTATKAMYHFFVPVQNTPQVSPSR